MLKIFMSVLLGFSAGAAQADYAKTFNFAKEFRVQDGQTESLDLNGIYYIKSLVIQAEGIRQDSAVEVIVNGDIKGTVYAPGADPSYVVTVADNADSIQFRHRSGGEMRIKNVKVVLGGASVDGSMPAINSVDDLAQTVINLVDVLSPYASLTEQTTYLVPMKIKAANVRVMNTAHGSLSAHTRAALTDLQNEIQKSDAYVTTLLEQEAFFDLAMEFLTVKETIKDLLD